LNLNFTRKIMLNLTTPTLLFSAVSLLLLAYTNRFLALAQLVRNLHAVYKEKPDSILLGQIKNLRKRLVLIRHMQLTGIVSLLICFVCMFLIFIGEDFLAELIFGLSMLLMIISLGLSAWEINISVKALDLHLGDIEEGKK
jgi:hypothetical protein